MATDDWERFKREFAKEVDALGIGVDPHYIEGRAVPSGTEQQRLCWREVGDTVRQVIDQGGVSAMRTMLDNLFAEQPPRTRARMRRMVARWANGRRRSKRDVKRAWARYVRAHRLDKQSAEAATLYGLGMAYIDD